MIGTIAIFYLGITLYKFFFNIIVLKIFKRKEQKEIKKNAAKIKINSVLNMGKFIFK